MIDHKSQSVRYIALVGHILVPKHASEVDFSLLEHRSRSSKKLEIGQGDFDERVVIVSSIAP